MKIYLQHYMLIYLTFAVTVAFGQYKFPEPGHVFDDSTVPRVDISIEAALLSFILDPNNQDSNTEYPATFYFTRENEIDTVENVGFRLRGNTSRAAAKKSFKVSFNSFEKGRRYKGLEKMNLNGEHNDPSIVRSKICWDIYSQVGIPGSRANHVELYINGEYRGLYINVEHIDERFVKERFSSHEGNLYKCLWPADLNYLGDDPNLYKNTSNGRRAYELKTNTEVDDYSGLAHFIDVLNNTNDENFKCELERVFDVDNYLKLIVMDILVSHWDGPIVNKNNFYLYQNPSSGRFTQIPFDLDNTLGIGWGGTQWAETDIYNWADIWGNSERPLYKRILAEEEYRNKITYYFQEYMDVFFNNENLDPYFDAFLTLLLPYRENDTYASFDYGWDVEAFKKSYSQGLGAHVQLGLKSYIDTRTNSAQGQLNIKDPLTLYEYDSFTWGGNELRFEIKVDFPWDVVGEVLLHYQFDDGSWESVPMVADDEDDYEVVIENIGGSRISYYFEAINFAGSRNWPECEFKTAPLLLEPEVHLVINEFLASNDSRNTDEAGEHEDWIEIYNPSDIEINPSSYYLTDDPLNPNKWQIDADLIASDSYLKIWADEDGNQGDLHANFKLSRGGEFLGLFFEKEGIYFPIDTLTFPEQTTDISYGRLPNGSGDYQVLPYPTFGLNNEGPSSVGDQSNFTDVQIFPNPAYDVVSIKMRGSDDRIKTIELWTLDGKLLLNKENLNLAETDISIDIEQNTQLLLLRLVTDSYQVINRKILVTK